MRKTSRYIWRIIDTLICLTLCLSAFAESADNSKSAKGKDKKEKAQAVLYGCYVDVDVMDPILHIFDNSRMGLDASFEIDLFHRIYPTFVFGYQTYDASDKYDYPIPADNICYKVDGAYFKVGLSANIWKKNFFKKLNPISYVGLNFGCAPNFHSEIDGYPLENSFWSGSDAEEECFSYDGNNKACWGEVLVGMKAPVAGHFCLGVEAIFKPLFHTESKDATNAKIHQSYAPGYGSEKNGKWGFRYVMSYYFSFFDKEPEGVDEY